MTDFSSTRSVITDTLGLVELTGEVDIYTAPRFKDDLVALIDDGATQVVVDLSQVTFIDSTALGVLIGGVKRLHEVGGTMRVVVATRPVERILSITGLDTVLAVFATRDEALAGL
jgi:anti-sigma B factor antagonist